MSVVLVVFLLHGLRSSSCFSAAMALSSSAASSSSSEAAAMASPSSAPVSPFHLPCFPLDYEALVQSSLWNPNSDKKNKYCCTWVGVTCALFPSSPYPRVVGLSLPLHNLTGPFPSSLSNLSFLHTLNLSRNRLSGPLPHQFMSLSALHSLDLSSNNLSGSISFLFSMPSLTHINVSHNRFHGPLFISYPRHSSSALQQLDARGNALSGPVPTDLCLHAGSLKLLDLSSNSFDGTLGHGLGLCMHLQELYLGFNSMSGPIPQDLYSIRTLSVLALESNRFSGNLNSSVGNLTALTYLSLSDNLLSGELPQTLSRNAKIRFLNLSSNYFSGTLNDVIFSNMTYLEELYLYMNSFDGNLPASLGSCASLRILNLALNSFTGNVPTEFNSLKSLNFVTLSTNRLAGSLLSFKGCSGLVGLFLSSNFFTETLPLSLDGLRNVQVLALGFLNLTGVIPDWLQNCSNLQVLDLSWNHLEGKIPDWIGNFKHLIYLDLSNNSLSGEIPLQLFGLPSLVSDDTNTTGLQVITNSLQVAHPSEFSSLIYSKAIDLPPSILLGYNHLTGVISPINHSMNMLVDLELQHNSLTGGIPPSFANITSLERLDLSFNSLTGRIPSILSRLTFLAAFNVSYNLLSGPIPLSNQFETFSPMSYTGNPGLCGPPILQPCSNMGNSSTGVVFHESRSRVYIIILSISIVVGVIVMLLAVVTLCWRHPGRAAIHQGYGGSRKQADAPGPVSSQDALAQDSVHLLFSNLKLTIVDIYRATNDFSSNNIIGCGGFGLVYRADFEDGSKLAIKKLTGDAGQMDREFRAEVEALSKARHENLVPLKGFMIIGHARILIYPYMENGSLDYWLHENEDAGDRLDWPRRLKIAQGTAAGLAYLHQNCNPHIVHRDIKSSNILLDGRFEAHLADFGLARLMTSTQTHVTTELVGTVGYIPPEYGEKPNATRRGDVYSFGVVLLELLTGRRPIHVTREGREPEELVAWVQGLRNSPESYEIFDGSLRWKGHDDGLYRVLDIAYLCVNHDPHQRPLIKDVNIMLDQISASPRGAGELVN